MRPTNTKIDATLARYLLSDLSMKQASVIDEKLLDDESYLERLNLTESALICDFICGGLSDDDRERLERRFLRSKEKARKIELAQFLYYQAHHPAALDDEDPAFEYLLGDHSKGERLELEETTQSDEDFKARLDYAEYELILAYLRGGLSSTERERFERYFLRAESPEYIQRIGKLRFTEIFCAYARRHGIGEFSHANRLHRLRRWLVEPFSVSMPRPAWQLMVAVPVVGLGALIWALFFYQSPITKGLNALKAAYAQERPVEARISGFAYAIYPAERGGDSKSYKQDVRDEAAQTITGATAGKENKSAREYQALGQLFLTDRNFNKAADYFNLALKQDDRNAKLYNDLAVTLMASERAKKPEESTGENYAQASEYLQRAIALDPSLLESHFNLALARQYQMLWRQAAEDWRKYLEKDSNSRWAEEAKSYLREIEELLKQTGTNRERLSKDFREAALRRDGETAWQTFRNSRTSFGSFVLNGVIDDYLSARLTGRTADADSALQILLFIGDVERARTGDRYTYDISNFYRVAEPHQLQRASEARALFKSAAESLRKAMLGEAVNKCRQAQAIFDQIGNTAEALLVQHLLGHCHLQQGSAKLSLGVLTEGLQGCEAKTYLWLLAIYHNALRNAHVNLMQYSKSSEHNQELIANARRVGDDLGVRIGLQGTSEIYMFLGRYRESLQAAQEGLTLAAKLRATPNYFVMFYTWASICYIGLGKLAAAVDYQQEGLRLSLEINDLTLTSRQYAGLGLALSKLGRHNEAVEAIRKAAEIGRSVQDRKKGGEIIAFSNLYMGQVYRDMGKYEDSARAYQEARQFYSESEIDGTYLLFEAAKGRLLTAIQGGDDATAAKDLERVIEFYEQHRVNIEDESSRNTFFNREQGIYDIAIDFAYSRRRNERLAFDYSELGRARSLLDTVKLPERKLPEGPLPDVHLPASIKPLSIDQIQPRIPDRTYILQYAALDDKLIIWVVSKNDLKSQVVPIGQEKLSGKVKAYLESLEAEWKRRSVDPRPQGVELYKILIEPVERWLNKDFEICVIPDKILHRLPFAALMTPTAPKYLIEERAIYVSPSANMFLVATDMAGRKASVKSERLLAVGNPQVDRDRFPRLVDLPNAASQAWEEAAFYDSKLVVLDGKAREAYVRREIEKSSVVDFAMHYVADERTPMLSILPLTAEKAPTSKARDGVLYTHELYGMNLSRLRLAILSGCQTGIERFYKGEGAVGLARAFQAAGVPLVVASLWGVEDRQAKVLMVALHRHRKQSGLTTAQALRRAQLDQIRSVDPKARSPYHWAAYIVVGGRASF